VSGFAAQKSSRAARKAKSTVSVGDHAHAAWAVAKQALPSLESNPDRAETLIKNAEASTEASADSAEASTEASTEALIKHAAVPTNGILKTRGLTSREPEAVREAVPEAVPRRPERPIPIPHKLANYESLVALLDALDPFCEAIGYGFSGKGQSCCCSVGYPKPELTASSVSDAVGALNRLKRLRHQVLRV
jgi:hypothetical protein